jgi:hypothetical protein
MIWFYKGKWVILSWTPQICWEVIGRDEAIELGVAPEDTDWPTFSKPTGWDKMENHDIWYHNLFGE